MKLTSQEKMKRVEIASSLLEYATMMEEMTKKPHVLIKNIFRKFEKTQIQNLYSQEKFEQIKKHHYFATIVSAFSFSNDEYITNLSLKNIGIDENVLTNLFVNRDDIEDYRNKMTGAIKDHEIIRLIRNALNHHENGILYKYIEEENAVEIDLKDVRNNKEKQQNPNGKPKRFHVKVPISILLNIIDKLSEVEQKKSMFFMTYDAFNCKALDIKEELKRNLKLFRIISKDNSFLKQEFTKVLKLRNEELKNRLLELVNDEKIELREYTYENGAITDWQIDSMCSIMQSNGEDDWRIIRFNDVLSYINAIKLQTSLPENVNETLARWLATRNIFQFGIITSYRFMASALFNKVCLKTWNSSFVKSIENEVPGIEDLNKLNKFQWFMLDPLEKIFVEYENFIRYAIVNFAPTYPDNIVTFNGKNYDCDFLRNAFAHGRVGYVRNNSQYMFTLYDCLNGLHNEVSYVNKKMYIPIELVRFAEHLCKEEKKKIEEEQRSTEEEKRKLMELRKNLTNVGTYKYNINGMSESFKSSKK